MRHSLTQQECQAESIIQILAGSDTTATALRSTMLHVMATPRVYQHLKSEIKEALANGRISSPITVEQAKKLPYLQARPVPIYLLSLEFLLLEDDKLTPMK